MDVAFYLPGRVPVYTFSLLIAIGSALGLFWAAQQTSSKAGRAITSTGIWTLFGAAIVGRALFVLTHWAYFRNYPLEIAQIWLGGIAWFGAVAGGILVVGLFSAISNQKFAKNLDAMIPLLTTLTVSAWLGCWVNGCIYGPETQAWWGVPARDEWGVFATRWPLQAIGALLSILIALGVDQGRHLGWIPSSGFAATLQTGGLALTLLGAAALRVDPVPQWRNLGLDTWAALGLLFLSITGTIVFQLTQPTNQQTN